MTTVPTTGTILQQQDEQQPPTTTAGSLLAVLRPENSHHEADCSSHNDYHRCDDIEENNRSGTNLNTMAILHNSSSSNTNNIGPPLATTEQESQRPSTTPWYNQRLIITFPINTPSSPPLRWQPYCVQQPVVPRPQEAVPPVRPPELQGIPATLWIEFFEQVHTATRTSSSIPHTASTLILLLNIAIMLTGVGILVLWFLYLVEIIPEFAANALLLYIVSVCLRGCKTRLDFDHNQHHTTPLIQAVCCQFSPAFEERTNYYVEYTNPKNGIQFCQKMIRQINNEEIRKERQHLKEVVMTSRSVRGSRNDVDDTAAAVTTAHYATLV
jgi:hypothetical protein